ncbi:MAG: hypothetical protein WBB31_07505 [Saprospiraceae bacterium]
MKILIASIMMILVVNFTQAGIIHVVTTTQDTRSITELIGGDKVEVTDVRVSLTSNRRKSNK